MEIEWDEKKVTVKWMNYYVLSLDRGLDQTGVCIYQNPECTLKICALYINVINELLANLFEEVVEMFAIYFK